METMTGAHVQSVQRVSERKGAQEREREREKERERERVCVCVSCACACACACTPRVSSGVDVLNQPH